MADSKNDKILHAVKESYAAIAKAGTATGCGPSTGCCPDTSPAEIANNTSAVLGYSKTELGDVPVGANLGLGCGNPQAIAALKAGETVVDLGSGAGFDSFLAAKQVGDDGTVIGIDMTPDMLTLARDNAVNGGFTNVEFRNGFIEKLPVDDNTADVIISNCVINLSPDKEAVFTESFRVLKPGGRLAISDVVATTEMPEEIKNDLALYSGCVAGASSIQEIEEILKKAGFANIEIKPKDESREFIRTWAPGRNVEEYTVAATIEAIKPM